MPIAALLDPLVNLCTDFIGSVGYAGVFVLTLLGSACIPIPSEATMMFAGFKVSDGDLTLFGVIAAGVTGELIGCLIAYAAGYYGRIDLLERNKLIHIDRKRLDWVDSWFQRRGDLTVFFGRLLPLVRAVGDNWEDWHRKLAFLDYVVVAAVIVGIAYLLIKRRGGGAKPESGPE